MEFNGIAKCMSFRPTHTHSLTHIHQIVWRQLKTASQNKSTTEKRSSSSSSGDNRQVDRQGLIGL